MKFICDNCKAKYQIGDEKVAGKMVRMKCRRCGHLVQVSASVTESSVAQALPAEPPRTPGEESHRASQIDDDPTTVFSASGEGSLASLVEAMTKAPGASGVPATKPAVIGASAYRPPSNPPDPLPRPAAAAPRPPIAPRPPVAGRPIGLPRPDGSPVEAHEGGQPQPQPAGRPAPAAPVRAPAPAVAAPVRAPAPSSAAPVRAPPSAAPVRAPSAAAPVRAPSAAAPVRAPSAAALVGAPPSPAARAPEPVPATAVAAFKPPASPERTATKVPAVVRVTPSEDWYVGVGGVPLGPVRLSVIRDKALAGAVDGESLVWREGFEEWQPLKSFPELLEIVTQAQATRLASPGRRVGASLSGPPASSGPVSLVHPGRSLTPASVVAPLVPPPGAVPMRAPLREPDPPPSEKEPVPVLFAAAGGAARAGADGTVPVVDMLPDPFAARSAGGLVAPESIGGAMLVLPGSSPPVAPAPVAPAPVAPAAEPAPLLATPTSLVETVSPRRRSGMSPLAYAFIAMAAAFGGVSAFFLLSPRPQPAQVVIAPPVQASSVAAIAVPPPPVDTAEPEPATPVGSASARADVTPLPPRMGGPLPPKAVPDVKPGASANSSPVDMSGFSGSGNAGPRPSPGSSGQSGALGQLSAGEISTVVEQNRPGVRRRCWQPSLEARANNAPTTARVTANLTIAASGAVQAVTATGSEKDYPGLSSCIGGRIQTWKFPASSGSTPAQIPFVFAAQ